MSLTQTTQSRPRVGLRKSNLTATERAYLQRKRVSGAPRETEEKEILDGEGTITRAQAQRYQQDLYTLNEFLEDDEVHTRPSLRSQKPSSLQLQEKRQKLSWLFRLAHFQIPWQHLLKGIFSWKALLITIGVAVVCYTIVFHLALACIFVSNTWQYGPTHTSYTHTLLHGQPATIIASNDDGNITIVVQTIKDGKTQTQAYHGPELNPAAWNNDLTSIVATTRVEQDGETITVDLVGNVNYLRPFFARPATSFHMVPDKQGYKIV